ncbi:MAG: hypothetical protein JSV13_01405 [Nitrospiraceae bacterium]|nr:MAG: hypothetical protein JSV13_01405 [Nitrospiraceae bacterium]
MSELNTKGPDAKTNCGDPLFMAPQFRFFKTFYDQFLLWLLLDRSGPFLSSASSFYSSLRRKRIRI